MYIVTLDKAGAARLYTLSRQQYVQLPLHFGYLYLNDVWFVTVLDLRFLMSAIIFTPFLWRRNVYVIFSYVRPLSSSNKMYDYVQEQIAGPRRVNFCTHAC